MDMGLQGGNSWSRIQQHLYYNPRLQEAAIKHQTNENKRLVIFLELDTTTLNHCLTNLFFGQKNEARHFMFRYDS